MLNALLNHYKIVTSEEYIKNTIGKDGRKRWQGGKHLAESASFTSYFCRALFRAWAEEIMQTAVAAEAVFVEHQVFDNSTAIEIGSSASDSEMPTMMIDLLSEQ